MSFPTFTPSGVKASTSIKSDKRLFGVVPTDHYLLSMAYVSYLANGRKNLANTKTRGDVRGGGRKPWRQKGTGRARFGSSRNPIWRGGGIAFGPTGNENYTKRITSQTKRLAVKQALSIAAQDNKIIVIEEFNNGAGKTAKSAKLLLKVGAVGNILLIVGKKDELIIQATRNLPKLKTVQSSYLNVFDLLNADTIIIEKVALEQMTDRLTTAGKTDKKSVVETIDE